MKYLVYEHNTIPYDIPTYDLPASPEEVVRIEEATSEDTEISVPLPILTNTQTDGQQAIERMESELQIPEEFFSEEEAPF
jgi:hypothetical protein